MSHFRDRHVRQAFEKLCKLTPIVGIFGHRQVGKTTFLENNCRDYHTLDDSDLNKNDLKNPKAFLARLKGHRSAIDECQLAPKLFPALKLWVQQKKKPGQFILSGSVRFTARKAIRESLTGRISTVELYPFVLSEVRKDVLPNFFPWMLRSESFLGFEQKTLLKKSEAKKRLKNYFAYLETGGFPGLFLIRDEQTRTRFMQDILRTVLDRDLRLVYETPLPYSDLNNLCTELSKKALEPVELSYLRKASGISPQTIKKLIDAFEAIYLIRKLPIEGGGRKGFIVWFEDQLEQNHLANYSLDTTLKRIGLAYRNIRAQFEYRLGSSPTYFHFRTRGGAMIPLAFRQGKDTLGVLPLESTLQLGKAEKASIASFLKTYNHSKVLVTVDENIDAYLENSRTLVAPVSAVY